MNFRLSLSVRWSMTLLIGLLLGFLYQPEIIFSVADSPRPTLTALPAISSPAPFKTFPGGLRVRVKFHRNLPPEIEKVAYLEKARIVVLPEGANQISILDKNGRVLYAQSFFVDFLDGSPPQPVNSETIILVLPHMEDEFEILITTSNGDVTYAIPAK